MIRQLGLFNLRKSFFSRIIFVFFIISLFYITLISNSQSIALQNQTTSKFDLEHEDECEKIGHFQFDRFSDIIVSNNIAYIISSDTGLHIFNVTNKLAPKLLFKDNYLGYYRNLAKEGNYLYLVNTPADSYNYFLTIYNVSNPSNPFVVSTTLLSLSRNIRDIVVQNDYVFYTTYEGFFVYNVSDHVHPLLVSSIYSDSTDELFLNGQIAYICNYIQRSIFVYNISTLTSPELLCQYEGNDIPTSSSFSPKYITIFDSYLLVVDFYVGLIIINSTSPTNLTYIHHVEMDLDFSCRSSILLVEDYFYINDGTNGVFILEKNNGTHPIYFGNYSCYAYQMTADTSHLYITNGAFAIFDIQNPGNIQLLSQIGIGGFYNAIKDIVIKNNYAFCAAGGLLILDISNLSNPINVYYSNEFGSVKNIKLLGNYLYLASFGNLTILDISNPLVPVKVGTFNSFEIDGIIKEIYNIDKIFIQDNYAYLTYMSAFKNCDFLVLDLSDPLNPIGVDNHHFDGDSLTFMFCSGNYVSGNKAYIGFGEILYIFDIKNKANLKIISTYNIEGLASIHDIVVESDYAFVGSYDGFVILDIHKSVDVRVVSKIDENSYTISVAGQYACLGRNELQLFDMSDPNDPDLITSYNDTETTMGLNPDPSSFIHKIILKDNHTFIGYGSNGFVIVELPITITGSIPVIAGYYILPFGLLVLIPIIITRKYNKSKMRRLKIRK